MHELAVTREIFNIVLRHAEAHGVVKVERIFLRIGELSGFEAQWIQHYFDSLSRGSVAEAAKIEVEISPLTFRCEDCTARFSADLGSQEGLICPACGGGRVRMEGGDDYTITHMEAW